MALSTFARGREDQDLENKPEGKPASAQASAVQAFIGEGCTFEGKLHFTRTVRIDGHFQGEIRGEETLVVGNAGKIEASVACCKLDVWGHVKGDIDVTEQVVLHRTARVEGDIEAASLVIDDGAWLQGRVSVREKSAGRSPTPLKAIAGG